MAQRELATKTVYPAIKFRLYQMISKTCCGSHCHRKLQMSVQIQKQLINSWNKSILVFYTQYYHLCLGKSFSLRRLGVCDVEVSPIGFLCSNTSLGHLTEVKHWDRRMFDLAKQSHCCYILRFWLYVSLKYLIIIKEIFLRSHVCIKLCKKTH